jgi:hypothetical protein
MRQRGFGGLLMLILPIETTDHKEDALVIVLGPDNIERMQEADPCEVFGYPHTLVKPKVMVCFEKPSPEWNTVLHSGNLQQILKYLTRGFKFRPELGDHDRGPESLKEQG